MADSAPAPQSSLNDQLHHADRLIKSRALKDALAYLTDIRASEARATGEIALRRARIADIQGDAEQHLLELARAINTLPKIPLRVYMQQGNALRKYGKPKRARTAYDLACSAFPKAPEPRRALAGVWVSAGEFQKALPLLQSAAQLAPENMDIALDYAKALISAGETAKAQAQLDHIQETYDDPDPAKALRISLCQSLGDLAAAAQVARSLSQDTASNVLLQSKTLSSCGFPQEADMRLLSKLDTFSGAPGFALEAAVILAKRPQNTDAAIALLEPVLRDAPGDIRASVVLARLYETLGRHKACDATLEAAIKAAGDDHRPVLALASTLRARSELDAAHAALTQHSDPPPKWSAHPDIRLLLAWVAAERGETKQSYQIATSLIAPPPADTKSLISLAKLFVHLNKSREETELLASALPRAKREMPILNYILERAFRSSANQALLDRCIEIAEHYPNSGARDMVRRLSLHFANFQDALDQVRLAGPHRNSPEEILDAFNALVGLNRHVLARRYLGFGRRRWPDSVPLLAAHFGWCIRFGALDELDALIAQTTAASPAMAEHLRAIAISARIHRNQTLSDADYEDLKADPLKVGGISMTVLQHANAAAHVPASDFLEEQMRRNGTLRQQLHWRTTPPGQLSTELKLTQQQLGADTTRAMISMQLEPLREIVRETSWSTITARLLITRYFAENGRGLRGAATAAPGFVPAKDRTIPARIYQYWNTDPPPQIVQKLSESWQNLPEHDHQMFSRKSALEFLRAEYGRDWVRAFHLAKRPAEEADLLRLCLLAKHGGIWADTDDLLFGDLSALWAGDEGLVLFRDPVNAAVINNIIAARPGHPVLVKAAQSACDALLQRANETIWAKTGPGLLTREVGGYLAATPLETCAQDISLLDAMDLRRVVSIHNRLPHKSTVQHWAAPHRGDPGFTGLLDKIIPR